MNKSERKHFQDDSTLISKISNMSTAPRIPFAKSNFSINALLPEIAERDTPPEGSPTPSPMSDVDDGSSDGDVNVDYESDIEGKHLTLSASQLFVTFCEYVIKKLCIVLKWI